MNVECVQPEDIKEGLKFSIGENQIEEDGFVRHLFEHFETIFSIVNKSHEPIVFSVDKVYDDGKVSVSSVSDSYKDGKLDKLGTLWNTRQLCNLIDKVYIGYSGDDGTTIPFSLYGDLKPGVSEETVNKLNKVLDMSQDAMSFSRIIAKMQETYIKKNHDYGNAFSEMYDELGINYGYGKIREKVNRIKTLKDGDAMVENEPLEDALLDCANYCILTLMEYQKHKENGKG